MKHIMIVNDGDTQDVHDAEGRFVELDSLIGATIVRCTRREEDGRLCFVLEGVEGDEDEGDEG